MSRTVIERVCFDLVVRVDRNAARQATILLSTPPHRSRPRACLALQSHSLRATVCQWLGRNLCLASRHNAQQGASLLVVTFFEVSASDCKVSSHDLLHHLLGHRNWAFCGLWLGVSTVLSSICVRICGMRMSTSSVWAWFRNPWLRYHVMLSSLVGCCCRLIGCACGAHSLSGPGPGVLWVLTRTHPRGALIQAACVVAVCVLRCARGHVCWLWFCGFVV